jgi:putative methyltransferase (TIGR04325 family)
MHNAFLAERCESMTLRDFVPPIAISTARRLMGHTKQKQYATYAEALTDCTEHGYENADIVNVVIEKTKRYRDSVFRKEEPIHLDATSAYSLCSLLTSIESQEIHVLDFGGACGAHYFLARAVLPSACRLKWLVVETPEMAQRAGTVLSSDELEFSSNLSDAADSMKRIDLLHTSGTLQCVDKPYDSLLTLVSVSASHILFNRLGLTKGNHDVITVHESWLSWNGPGPLPSGIPDRKVRYPLVFQKESTFYDAISRNYDIAMTFDDPSGVLPVNNEPIVGVGLLARRKR